MRRRCAQSLERTSKGGGEAIGPCHGLRERFSAGRTGFLAVASWRALQAACTRIKLSGEIETELTMLSRHTDRGRAPTTCANGGGGGGLASTRAHSVL